MLYVDCIAKVFFKQAVQDSPFQLIVITNCQTHKNRSFPDERAQSMRPHVQFIRYNIAEMHRVHLAVIQFTPQRL